MTLRNPAKVLLHMLSYDLYDMTLSTGKQRCHMIKESTDQPHCNVHRNKFSILQDHWSCSSPERLSHCKLMRFKLIEN